MIQVKEFFNTLRKNIIIESFTDQSYRMLVTIPEAKVYKSQKRNNSWLAEIWIAEALFEHLCPFLYCDSFKQNLKNHHFVVLFEIIKVFSSNTTRKEFNIKQFLESHGSNFNGRQKKQINALIWLREGLSRGWRSQGRITLLNHFRRLRGL